MHTPPSQPGLTNTLLAETQQLKAAWQRHNTAFLDTYLVRDVEDPRINIQSILTRHCLIRTLFHDRYAVIMEHELYFAMAVNWLLTLLKSLPSRQAVHDQIADILHTLLAEENTPDTSVTVPPFIAAAFGKLAFPNYIGDLLMWVPRELDDECIPDYQLNRFRWIWAQTLAAEQAPPLRVIEPACGSANDYRFWDDYGLTPFLRYTGFDLSEKNIRNAKARFPDVDFRVASVFDIPAQDKTCHLCVVHDLFEHLSPEGIDRAIAEIGRVTAQKACLHFFNMDDAPEDAIRKKGEYYWNRLSCETMHKRLEPAAAGIEQCRLNTWLNDRFAYPHYYNSHAFTLHVQMNG